MDSITEQNVRAAIAELNKTGVSYVLMIEDDGTPSVFYNDPNMHYYLVQEQKEGE